jgi:hypothetical protein
VLLLFGALLLFGCARDLKSADAPGEPCEADAECNRGADGAVASCGWLRLCIAGRCEARTDAGGSHLVVCTEPDAASE